MAEGWKTVRVFISSTFRDMQAERDHLVRFVFPRLREELLRRRIHLVDVDLRWGVTSDQDAFELCMDEIDRCKPRFLCMLGGRYGWVPPARAGSAGTANSITASEIHYAALDKLDAPAFRYLYFRDPLSHARFPIPHATDYREADGSPASEALEAIKRRISTVSGRTITAPGETADVPLPLLVYPCAWDHARRASRSSSSSARACMRTWWPASTRSSAPRLRPPSTSSRKRTPRWMPSSRVVSIATSWAAGSRSSARFGNTRTPVTATGSSASSANRAAGSQPSSVASTASLWKPPSGPATDRQDRDSPFRWGQRLFDERPAAAAPALSRAGCWRRHQQNVSPTTMRSCGRPFRRSWRRPPLRSTSSS